MTTAKSNSGMWSPETYMRFANYRARPFEDLLPHIALSAPGAIYDLGCGTGNLTRQLKDRWPDRTVTGMDSSKEMLDAARKKYGESDLAWQLGDIATWSAPAVALVFTNAALHWVPDHEHLFPRLFSHVAPGGVLAVQMPVTATAPYHLAIPRVKRLERWQARLAGVEGLYGARRANFYYDLLAPVAADIDLWETDYHHVLENEQQVAEWASGAALVPFLTALSDEEKPAFLADYRREIASDYPPRSDGKVIFTMRRIFIVAKRR